MVLLFSRTPHGVRGLKPAVIIITSQYKWSHPSRGAWIETPDVVR